MMYNFNYNIPAGFLEHWKKNASLYAGPKFNRLIWNKDKFNNLPDGRSQAYNNIAYGLYFSEAQRSTPEYIQNVLPPHYDSWLELFYTLKREDKENPELQLFNGNMIQIDYQNRHGKRFIFQLNHDFIKARAFEEMIDKIPPRKELHNLKRNTMMSYYGYDPLFGDLQKLFSDLMKISKN
ncbi:MAG: hypothetical protein ACO1OF_16370 [Adhaeribacter sp.]